MLDRICYSCNGSNLRRSTRHGFLESFVFSLIGMYPWRCRDCECRTMLRDRGDRKRRGTRVVVEPKAA